MKNYEATFNSSSKPQCTTCGCDAVKGNSIGIEINKDDCEIRADVVVARTSAVRIWGKVQDCYGHVVANALVKLVKVVNTCHCEELEGIAHTVTDCNGFYQFEVDGCEVGSKYKILVHKAAYGKERTVCESSMECNPCLEPNCYNSIPSYELPYNKCRQK